MRTLMPPDLFNVRRARLIKWQEACTIAAANWLGSTAIEGRKRVALAIGAMRLSLLVGEYL